MGRMAQPAASTTRTQNDKTFVLGFIFISYPGGNWRLFSNKPTQKASEKYVMLKEARREKNRG
jgi:hypothetical protein